MATTNDKGLTLETTNQEVREPVILRVKGLRGKYGSAMFDNTFTSVDPESVDFRTNLGKPAPVEPSLANEIINRFGGLGGKFVRIVNPQAAAA